MNNYIVPPLILCLYYLLACVAPVMISATPIQLGPEVFSGIITWRLLTNWVVILLSLRALEGEEFLVTVRCGMELHAYSMVGVAVGLGLFLKFSDKDFDVRLLWRKMTGRMQIKNCWQDDKIWAPDFETKEHEQWYLVSLFHPQYLPFDEVTSLLDSLAEKYGDGDAESRGEIERPSWLVREQQEAAFIDRIVCIYEWKGVHWEEGDR